jgi:ankyrin repeat protein
MTHYQRKELLRVVGNGNIRRLSALIEDGVELNFVNSKTGMTPLMTAAYAGHTNVVNLLIDSGASVKLSADDGASALHWASLNGHLEIVKVLIDSGADVNVRRGADGPAPLHMAINSGHDSIALLLINAGTSLDTEYIGRDVEEYAKWHELDEIARYVREISYRNRRVST